MQSGSPFFALFPDPPPIRTPQGLPGLRAEEKSESLRSHTSEQKKVLEVVTNSVQSNKSDVDSADMENACDKLQTMSNSLASEQVFNNIDLGSLLKDIVIKKKEL